MTQSLQKIAPLTATSNADKEQESQLFLTFQLKGETFAVSILAIKEIIECGAMTIVPLMPDYIRGVINLRGAVVPVIDLAARFNRGVTGVARRTCIVIIEIRNGDEAQDIGVLVDAVNEVIDIPATAIQRAPTFGAKIRADFISAMAEIHGVFFIILNLNHVLSIEELALLNPNAHALAELALPA